MNNLTNSHVLYITFSPRSTAFLSYSAQKILQLQEKWPTCDSKLGLLFRVTCLLHAVLVEPQLLCFPQKRDSTDCSWHTQEQEGTWGCCSAGFQGNGVWLSCTKWEIMPTLLPLSWENARAGLCFKSLMQIKMTVLNPWLSPVRLWVRDIASEELRMMLKHAKTYENF